MNINPDRVVGGIACVLAIAVAVEARTFRVGFYTDPLGPGGVPYIVAALVGIAGLLLLTRPTVPAHPASTTPTLRVSIVTAMLFAYAAILPLVGFFLSTTLAIAVISMVFGGPGRRIAIAAALYTVALFTLFSIILGLSLPIGSLFTRAG